MKKEDTLGLSLIETIQSSELPEIGQDIAEIALDSLLQDGALKDIPIISTIIGTSKTISAIRDYFLIRKIWSFLQGIKDVGDKEKSKFIKDMEGDKNHRREVGEKLIMLLDRLDDLSKPEMIAKLFKAHLKDKITLNEFFRFSSIIERVFINDLTGLLKLLDDDMIQSGHPYTERLYHLGLSEIKFDDSIYQKIENGMDSMTLGKSPTFARTSMFHEPIQFKLSEVAYVIAQILLEKKIYGNDYVATYRNQRKFRKE